MMHFGDVVSRRGLECVAQAFISNNSIVLLHNFLVVSAKLGCILSVPFGFLAKISAVFGVNPETVFSKIRFPPILITPSVVAEVEGVVLGEYGSCSG